MLKNLLILLLTGVTLIPEGVTIVGVTTFTPGWAVDRVVIEGAEVTIFFVAAAAAANAAIPVI